MTEVARSYRDLFDSEARRDARLSAIAQEARDRGVSSYDVEAFSGLAESRSALRELTGAEADPAHPFAALLFQAFHFRKGGSRILEPSEAEVRALIEARPETSWSPDRRPTSAYVRLPQRLFLAPASGGGPAAWLGGFYWVHGGGRLTVLGEMFTDANDVTLLPLPPLPSSMVALWARESVREGGGDYGPAPGMPPSRGLAIAVAAEILKLAALMLWDTRTAPGPEGEGGEESPADARPGGTLPSDASDGG
jgi:hypothetical protein